MSYYSMPHFDWLGDRHGEISDFGREVAYIVGVTFGGIYNAPIEHGRTKWSDERAMNVIVARDLATWDFDGLTKLVLLAHDMCVRVDIQPAIQWYRWNADAEESQRVAVTDHPDDVPTNGEWAEPCLRIWFHKRRTRDGGMSERHPTIEQAVKSHREQYKHPDIIWENVKEKATN